MNLKSISQILIIGFSLASSSTWAMDNCTTNVGNGTPNCNYKNGGDPATCTSALAESTSNGDGKSATLCTWDDSTKVCSPDPGSKCCLSGDCSQL